MTFDLAASAKVLEFRQVANCRPQVRLQKLAVTQSAIHQLCNVLLVEGLLSKFVLAQYSSNKGVAPVKPLITATNKPGRCAKRDNIRKCHINNSFSIGGVLCYPPGWLRVCKDFCINSDPLPSLACCRQLNVLSGFMQGIVVVRLLLSSCLSHTYPALCTLDGRFGWVP